MRFQKKKVLRHWVYWTLVALLLSAWFTMTIFAYWFFGESVRGF